VRQRFPLLLSITWPWSRLVRTVDDVTSERRSSRTANTGGSVPAVIHRARTRSACSRAAYVPAGAARDGGLYQDSPCVPEAFGRHSSRALDLQPFRVCECLGCNWELIRSAPEPGHTAPTESDGNNSSLHAKDGLTK